MRDTIGAGDALVVAVAHGWLSEGGLEETSAVANRWAALEKVFPYGLSLALGGIGFGTIASFITLYYGSRHWQNVGIAFVAARLLFANTINRWDGYRVAIVSLAFECAGLLFLWRAEPNKIANALSPISPRPA